MKNSEKFENLKKNVAVLEKKQLRKIQGGGLGHSVKGKTDQADTPFR